jgi:uncharacterized protein YneF (UPF0154 family)
MSEKMKHPVDSKMLITNIYLFIAFKNGFVYKNVDQFFINVNTRSFYHISNYLNRKNQKSNNLNDNPKINKKFINLYFIKYGNNTFIDNLVNNTINLLKNKYLVYINPNNPDYLIYNVDGCEFLDSKYNNSINKHKIIIIYKDIYF